MRKSALKCSAQPFGRIAAVRFTKSFMSSTKSPVRIGHQWWSGEKLSLFLKEILRLRVNFFYRLVVKFFATSTTSVSGTLSIFNLPNGKWICGNTNLRGQENMFWNHLWIPSWRPIIFGQTQRRRTLYNTRGRWSFRKKGQKKWCIVFRKMMMVTMNPSIIKMNISLSGEIMTIVFTMNWMIITMEILVGFVGQMITENPGCSSARSKILNCFPGALNILNQVAGTVQRTFEYKMYYSDQSSYQLFWPGW